MDSSLEGLDLADRLQKMSARVEQRLKHLHTEEATKIGLVLPFIDDILGFDVHDPTEVVPEFVADHGTKRGEKVDFAVIREGQPIMLFECKHVGVPLEGESESQLYRYFAVTAASVGVLTDGVRYRFFSDIEERNKMDAQPFLEFNLLEPDEVDVGELKRFTKPLFDHAKIRKRARGLKYMRAILHAVAEEWTEPSDEFVRHFAQRVYSGIKTRAVIAELRPLTQQALRQFLNQRVRNRLRSALAEEEAEVTTGPTTEDSAPPAQDEDFGQPPSGPRRISGFILWGQKKPVSTWKQMLISVAEACWKRNPAAFESRVVGWRGTKWDVVGDDPEKIVSPSAIPGSQFFISTWVSSADAERRAREILKRCEFQSDDLQIQND